MFTADDALEVRVPLKAGLRQVIVTVVKSDAVKPEGLGPARIPIWGHDYDGDARAPLVVSLLLIGGPYNGQVPQDSPSRRRIFVCRPGRRAETRPRARRRLSRPWLDGRIAGRRRTRTFRRCLASIRRAEPRETSRPVFARRSNGFSSAPIFCFGLKPIPIDVDPGHGLPALRRRTGLALVVLPVEQHPGRRTARLGDRGKLRDARVLDQQVRRMLDRSACARGAGGELSSASGCRSATSGCSRRTPTGNFRGLTTTCGPRSSRRRSCSSRVNCRRTAASSELLTADYTFLNEQLARHYGIRDVYGSHFRRVTLTDENRCGLLGKASILSVTSYPHRTSPTIRGKWLLENILAAPVPPPPPTVNTNLDEEDGQHHIGARDAGAAPRESRVRELSRAHGSAGVQPREFRCARAVAHERTARRRSTPPACCWTAPGSTVPRRFDGALLAQKEQFVKAVTEKLLVYALGRQMEYYDAPAIRAIVRAAAADDYRWSSTILAIVKSAPFQMRRAGS